MENSWRDVAPQVRLRASLHGRIDGDPAKRFPWPQPVLTLFARLHPEPVPGVAPGFACFMQNAG